MTSLEKASGLNMKIPKISDITIMKNPRIQTLEKIYLSLLEYYIYIYLRWLATLQIINLKAGNS